MYQKKKINFDVDLKKKIKIINVSPNLTKKNQFSTLIKMSSAEKKKKPPYSFSP